MDTPERMELLTELESVDTSLRSVKAAIAAGGDLLPALFALESARHRLSMCLEPIRGDYIDKSVDDVVSIQDPHERSSKISELKSVICACK